VRLRRAGPVGVQYDVADRLVAAGAVEPQRQRDPVGERIGQRAVVDRQAVQRAPAGPPRPAPVRVVAPPEPGHADACYPAVLAVADLPGQFGDGAGAERLEPDLAGPAGVALGGEQPVQAVRSGRRRLLQQHVGARPQRRHGQVDVRVHGRGQHDHVRLDGGEQCHRVGPVDRVAGHGALLGVERARVGHPGQPDPSAGVQAGQAVQVTAAVAVRADQQDAGPAGVSRGHPVSRAGP
jgi:hypothetical protein